MSASLSIVWTSVPAERSPGEVVWATVMNPKENPDCIGKPRPAVLVTPLAGAWLIMGLTTNPRYRNGLSRIPVPSPEAIGLAQPGWLWGDRPTRIPDHAIGDHVGWIDHALAGLIVRSARLDVFTARSLLDAAGRHHPHPDAA